GRFTDKLKCLFYKKTELLGIETTPDLLTDGTILQGIYTNTRLCAAGSGTCDRLVNPEQDRRKLIDAGIPFIEVK
ncbi:MAG: hypothetical protein HY370_09050, partial [Proteobacteria bacterium]|nr:hypothetical protein [Pseudomonadota bacterium]